MSALKSLKKLYDEIEKLSESLDTGDMEKTLSETSDALIFSFNTIDYIKNLLEKDENIRNLIKNSKDDIATIKEEIDNLKEACNRNIELCHQKSKNFEERVKDLASSILRRLIEQIISSLSINIDKQKMNINEYNYIELKTLYDNYINSIQMHFNQFSDSFKESIKNIWKKLQIQDEKDFECINNFLKRLQTYYLGNNLTGTKYPNDTLKTFLIISSYKRNYKEICDTIKDDSYLDTITGILNNFEKIKNNYELKIGKDEFINNILVKYQNKLSELDKKLSSLNNLLNKKNNLQNLLNEVNQITLRNSNLSDDISNIKKEIGNLIDEIKGINDISKFENILEKSNEIYDKLKEIDDYIYKKTDAYKDLVKRITELPECKEKGANIDSLKRFPDIVSKVDQILQDCQDKLFNREIELMPDERVIGNFIDIAKRLNMKIKIKLEK